MSNPAMGHYYAARAEQYDRIYHKPERQDDLRRLEGMVEEFANGRHLLEIAAGTGYWTQFTDGAASVLATDLSPEVLEVARRRREWPDSVTFSVADAFSLDRLRGDFDAAFAGFLWSHLSGAELDALLVQVARRVGSGATVMFADNRYVEGSSTPIVRTDDEGNSYQARRLDDGSTWEVMKNFPPPATVARHLESVCDRVEVIELDYFWAACATVR